MCDRGCSSVVERQLPKLNVVGSSPITRLKDLKPPILNYLQVYLPRLVTLL